MTLHSSRIPARRCATLKLLDFCLVMSLLLLHSQLASATSYFDATTVISTPDGLVRGGETRTARFFLGLPYAASTGGRNRFLPPKAVTPWEGERNATYYRPGCVQMHHNADVPKEQSEDCLFLNVFVPVDANATAGLAVMVFFHGGAYLEGSSIGPFEMYSGVNIVGKADVIVVTCNYRLGAFGWLAAGGRSISPNNGLRDVLQALRWVQSRIAVFGGDPARVTIWGESAGAMTAGLLLTGAVNASKGLFSRAIMESNVAGFRYHTLEQAKVFGRQFCRLLNCWQCELSCLQNKPAADVGHAWSKANSKVVPIVLGNWGYWLDAALGTAPTVDGVLVAAQPTAVLQGDGAVDADVLIGSNENEGSTFIYAAVKRELPAILVEGALR